MGHYIVTLCSFLDTVLELSYLVIIAAWKAMTLRIKGMVIIMMSYIMPLPAHRDCP